ncbi:MAG: FHA domain-containing protein [Boseongicola sp.]|nr:FHA domain-containing protein [Boseongicola sp.]
MCDEPQVIDPFPNIGETAPSLEYRALNCEVTDATHHAKGTRVKTRLINFRKEVSLKANAHARLPRAAPGTGKEWPPCAKLTIVKGPGKGRCFPIENSVVNIGRDSDQELQIDFGDTSISRKDHASIAYYDEHVGFLIREGMRPNPVFLNGRTVGGDQSLRQGDLIQVGATVLQFSGALHHSQSEKKL